MLRQTTRRMLLTLFGSSGAAAIGAAATPAAAQIDDRIFFASRADAAAASFSFFQQFLRTAGYYRAGDGGGALYARVAQPPAHALAFTSADGAHWELVPENGMVNVLQAGARGDGSMDDAPAIMDALGAFSGFAREPDQGLTVLLPPVPGAYRCASPLELRHRVRLVGHGFFDRRRPQLLFDEDVTGIIVHNAESDGQRRRGRPGTRATWSWLEGLTLGGRGRNPDAHGFVLRAKVRMRDCMAAGFPGDGFHIVADSQGEDAPFGNTNHSHLIGVTAHRNGRHGMYVRGRDTNAMTVVGLDSSYNGRFGLWDESLLGNTYVGLHVDANGVLGRRRSCLCTHDGWRYCAHYRAEEAALRTTRPGTDSRVWIRVEQGGPSRRYLPWTGQDRPGTFHAGGPVAVIGRHNRSTLGGYIEPDQGGMHLNGRSGWIGGHTDAPGLIVYGQGKAERGNLVHNGGQIYQFRRNGEDDLLEVRIREGADHRLMAFHRKGGSTPEWYYDPEKRYWGFSDNRDYPKLMLPDEGHDLRAGRPERIPSLLAFPSGFVLGDPADEGRYMTRGKAPPTRGDHAQGEIVFDSDPRPGGQIGWVCVVAGTPGRWVRFGRIEES